MLDSIKQFLFSVLTPERAQLFNDGILLIYNYNFMSPIEMIYEVTMSVDTNGMDETLYLIESIINDNLSQIIAQHYIISRGDFVFKTKLLNNLNMLEHYMDSEVIVHMHNDDDDSKEMLLAYFALVDNTPIEIYDEKIIDVRDTLINNLYKKHQSKMEERVENQDEFKENLTAQRSFAQTYPNSLGVRIIQKGYSKLNCSLDMLVSKYKKNIYNIEDPKDLALAIYSLVVISSTKPMNYNTAAMEVINQLYNDLHLVGELRYLVTSFKIPEVGTNNVNS